MTMIIINFISALLLTEAVEILVLYIMGYRKKNIYLTLSLINLITNPTINFIVTLLYSLKLFIFPGLTIAVLEVSVIIVEWQMLKHYAAKTNRSYLILSIAANLASYTMGFLVFK